MGVNIYPVDGFLLSNTNEWTKSGDSMKTFKTLNRLSYVFDARNIIQAYWNYSDLHDMSRHEGSFSFDKLWCSWLRTTPVVKTTIVDDEMGNSISVAPKLMVNLNVLNFGIINALSNLHEVEVRWNRHNGIPSPTPDLNYLFGLRLDFKPNIELQIKNTMVRFKEGKFDDFTSELLFSLYF